MSLTYNFLPACIDPCSFSRFYSDMVLLLDMFGNEGNNLGKCNNISENVDLLRSDIDTLFIYFLVTVWHLGDNRVVSAERL